MKHTLIQYVKEVYCSEEGIDEFFEELAKVFAEEITVKDFRDKLEECQKDDEALYGDDLYIARDESIEG